MSLLSSRRLSRLGTRELSVLAFMLMAAGLETAYLWMLPPLLLLGTGFSLGLLRMNELTLGLLPASLAGSAAALAATLGRIGANLGQVLGGELLLVVSTAALAARLHGEGLDGAQTVTLACLLTAILAWVGLRPAVAGAGNTGALGKLSTE